MNQYVDHLVVGSWKQEHKKTIENVLSFINAQSHNYILKGGTSLMECYGLTRFSEDIDFDSTDAESIFQIMDKLAETYDYKIRLAKNTDTVKRFMIDYGGHNEYGDKPLKVEISYRRKEIPNSERTVINGIQVYSLDSIAFMKSNAYSSRDRIRDLYDLTFLINTKFNELNPYAISSIRLAFEHKGIEQFDYILETQSDDLIDKDRLEVEFLNAFDRLGLLSESSDRLKGEIHPDTYMQGKNKVR